MAADSTLGARLREKRREKGLTQEQFSDASGVSKEMIAKVEQGRRQPRLPVLLQFAKALDISLSELVDNRPRLNGQDEGASVLAIRDVLLSAAHLPGVILDPDDNAPVSVAELRASVDEASRLYWSGGFASLAAMLPALIGEAHLTAQVDGHPAYSLLAQAYDLASALMVHLGKEDLAAIGAERAIAAAQASDDELLHAMEVGNFAWVMLHQGRLEESEQLAALTAQRMEPTFSASDQRVAVYGSLLMTALAPAAARGGHVHEYVSLASAAAARLGRRVKIYQTSFAPATVHMQACHAHAVLREPGQAISAARKIGAGDLEGISYGRHLLDVAQVHTDARHLNAATSVLTEARSIAPVSFRHQGIARSLVDDLFEQERRISPALRALGASVDSNWYAPYTEGRISLPSGTRGTWSIHICGFKIASCGSGYSCPTAWSP